MSWVAEARALARDAADVGPGPRPPVALLRAALREDLRRSVRGFVTNSVAGSVLVPRVLRLVLLRASGHDVRTANIFEHCTFDGPAISIGKGTFVNQLCYFEGVGGLTIGERCQIGVGVVLLTSSHPFDDVGGFAHRPVGASTTIGDRCWLGAGAIVLPGVTIGDDVVVGAGAVVTSDCAPAGVYVGAPARRVRDLRPTGVDPR